MATRVPVPKTLTCIVTGQPIEWCGYGRPPKYSAEGARRVKAKARQKLRAKKKEALKLIGGELAA